MLWLAGDVKEPTRLSQREGHEVPGGGKLGDISYIKLLYNPRVNIVFTFYLFSDWPKAYSEIFAISARDVRTADYTIIMSRTLKVTGNSVTFPLCVASRQSRSKNLTSIFSFNV